MVPYVPTGRHVARIKVEVRPGVWKPKSTGTYDVLAVLEEPRQLPLYDLWTAYESVRGDVDALRATLADVPLASYRAAFLAFTAKEASEDTARHYAVYLRALESAGLTHRRDLTVPRLSVWLESLDGAPATRRKYAMGVSAFCSWLVRHGHLGFNAMLGVLKPTLPPGRMSWVETADAIRIADAQPSPWRELSAVLAGTALDVTPATQLTRGQVQSELIDGVQVWTLALRRPKTKHVQKILVAEWAVAYLLRACEGKMPTARLFPGTDRYNVGKHHRAACRALGIVDYRARDARHTWAVRWAKANGYPLIAAEQLGHKDGGALYLKLYGMHIPTTAEKVNYERVAAARDRRA